mmetsp:Transcript_2699/g.4886  ORF Transcript_2699/g.4886 Transcript_2699/m.4886 type:complete len:145 (-) Transcript_2699:22-456(-)
MKFSTSILSAVLVLSASTSTTYGFSNQMESFRKVYPSVTPNTAPLASTAEETSASTTTTVAATITPDENASANGLNDTSSPTLSPEFQKARDTAVSMLTTSLPNPALEKPLVHFMDEYFTSLATSANSGSKNPDGSEITAGGGF